MGGGVRKRINQIGGGLAALAGIVAVGMVIGRGDWTAWTFCVFMSGLFCVVLGLRATGWVKRPSRWRVAQAAQQQMLDSERGKQRAAARRRRRRLRE